MHPSTSALCVPLTVPVSSIGVVLITVASLAVSMVVTREVVVVFETALTWGVRLLSFLVELVRLVALACCVLVWVSVRVVLTPVVFNVQSTVFVVGHFALLFVVLQLVSLSRCQVGCYPDALLSHFFSEVPVSKNRHLVISATESDYQWACVLP